MKKRRFRTVLLLVVFQLVFAGMIQLSVRAAESKADSQNTGWNVPPNAAELKSPLPATDQVIKKGREIYMKQCATCHGKSGKGDGPAAKFLGKPLPDFTSPAVAQQSEGVLFWKITNGNPPMPSWKAMLSEQDRWAVVLYLKSLAKSKK